MVIVKKHIFLIILVLLSSSIYAQCSGSANCSTCTNCTRCKNCKNGGVCGVCSPQSFKAKKQIIQKKEVNHKQKLSEETVNTTNKYKVSEEKSMTATEYSTFKEEKKTREVFTVVQEMPEFPGGSMEMMKYIQKNIHYPQKVKDAGISGKCFTKFIVNTDGNIEEAIVLKGIPGCRECDEEAIRVLKSMPKWKAGKQNGENVLVFFNLPINFQNK